MNIAKGIKVILAQKGLQQKYVAERAGFTEQQFSAMLNGRKLILAEHMPGIAQALGVSIAEVYSAAERA